MQLAASLLKAYCEVSLDKFDLCRASGVAENQVVRLRIGIRGWNPPIDFLLVNRIQLVGSGLWLAVQKGLELLIIQYHQIKASSAAACGIGVATLGE